MWLTFSEISVPRMNFEACDVLVVVSKRPPLHKAPWLRLFLILFKRKTKRKHPLNVCIDYGTLNPLSSMTQIVT